MQMMEEVNNIEERPGDKSKSSNGEDTMAAGGRGTVTYVSEVLSRVL